MKLFKEFRLDSANHQLWRNEDPVPITPKAFDVLAYLIENAGQVVTQDKMLEALWPETYVNPEILRKYILEIRKTLGDRPDKPEFIKTLPKRGYQFIASVIDEGAAELPNSTTPPPTLTVHTTEELGTTPALYPTDEKVKPETVSAKPQGSVKRTVRMLAITAVLAMFVATGIGGYLRPTTAGSNARSSHNTSIAVLPFADLSPGKDEEYFSDGLSEQLIHNLAKVPGLKVVGRSSAFQFKGKNEDVREVGRKLGVSNVLEGSVQREGNQVRITAELIKAEDGFQLWSQTYDRKINDIFAVQDEIARATSEALQIKLLGGNGQPVASTLRSANPEAYQAFLQGKYFLGRGTGKEDLGKALAYADQAIKLDGKYAPAWALRASVQGMITQFALTDFTDGFRKARDDAERAIALDPNLASAYLALAKTQILHDWDWDAANTCLTKAGALEPGNEEVFRIHSHLSEVLGNLDQAIRFEEQAVALDPLRANSRLSLGDLLYMAGQYDKARASLQKALDLNPQAARVHFSLGKVLIAEGRPEQALLEVEKEPLEWAKLMIQAMAYHALGREQDSNAALAGLTAKYATDWAYQIAQVYAFRGETDKSFAWLERAYNQRDPGVTEIKADPLLKSLRHDPKCIELLKKMHLPIL